MESSAQNQSPRDSATLVVVRDGKDGLEVLLAHRNSGSRVLANAYVFPGGKLERSDQSADLLNRLDQPVQRLHTQLSEPDSPPEHAAALYVAAIREAAEESDLLFLTTPTAVTQSAGHALCQRLRASAPFAALLTETGATLACSALAPWSRWITPRDALVINRRFDTRFFLAKAPAGQGARADAFEINKLAWLTPKAALMRYEAREILLIPPQIISLMQLLNYTSADAALHAARTRKPPLIEPRIFHEDGRMLMCYPGDEAHPVRQPAFPAWVPTRLVVDGQHFMPIQGYAPFLHAA
ncbi:MAG: NUDIX hydrolase [Burkholderiaceae bacterium]|nr:MAG: NUDIX hydrolase [Burkholderiaceae bacterium]